MKNTFSYILFCILFINNIVYAFEQDFVRTKAMDIIYDDTKKQFISIKDEKNKAIEVIFNNEGDVLKLGNKTIIYNNGKIVRIGKSYLTYLNGKIYTVGNENVYLNERGDSITKIGNTSIQKYFTGEEVTYNDIKSIPYGCEMTFYLNADGTGFGGSNSGIYIPFEDTEIVEIETKNINNGFFTKNGNIKKIGDKTIKYNLNGEILKIGDEGVS